jgi:hypothetical protein
MDAVGAGLSELIYTAKREFSPAPAADDVAFLMIGRPLLKEARGHRVNLESRMLSGRMLIFGGLGKAGVSALRAGQLFRETVTPKHGNSNGMFCRS